MGERSATYRLLVWKLTDRAGCCNIAVMGYASLHPSYFLLRATSLRGAERRSNPAKRIQVYCNFGSMPEMSSLLSLRFLAWCASGLDCFAGFASSQ